MYLSADVCEVSTACWEELAFDESCTFINLFTLIRIILRLTYKLWMILMDLVLSNLLGVALEPQEVGVRCPSLKLRDARQGNKI